MNSNNTTSRTAATHPVHLLSHTNSNSTDQSFEHAHSAAAASSLDHRLLAISMMQATTTSSHHSSSTQFSQLPTALTARILQRVPLEQRLTCCSLVCGAWRVAAAQATVHIECSLTSDTAKQFEAWLAQHGQQVQTLNVTGKCGGSADTAISLELPWARLSRLQSLSLNHGTLASSALINHSNSGGSTPATALVGSSDGSADTKANNVPPPLLPRLRELQLSCCPMDSPDVLVQLASNSPQLTSLVVEDCSTGSASKQTIKDVLPALLKHLPGLVVLRLPNQSINLAAARHVAAMHSLRELQSGHWGKEAAQLPSSLTSLTLDGHMVPLQPKLPTQLPALTQLVQLNLSCCTFPAAALASMPQLQHLRLSECELLPCLPSADSNSAGTAALLAALPKLTRLQHLHLECTGLDTVSGSPAAWAALTASTQLTHLYVAEEEGQPLHKDAAAHMFPAGRRLPHLQTLEICACQLVGWCLTGADLARINATCPGLQTLGIVCVMGEGEDVAALLQLPTGCSSLRIGGEAFGDDAAAIVKQLTQLCALEWEDTNTLSDAGLFQLIDLTALTSLRLDWCYGLSSGIWGSAGDRTLRLEASGTKGPVWQQLLSVCHHSPECAAAAHERMAAEFEDLRRQLAANQARVEQLLAAGCS